MFPRIAAAAAAVLFSFQSIKICLFSSSWILGRKRRSSSAEEVEVDGAAGDRRHFWSIPSDLIVHCRRAEKGRQVMNLKWTRAKTRPKNQTCFIRASIKNKKPHKKKKNGSTKVVRKLNWPPYSWAAAAASLYDDFQKKREARKKKPEIEKENILAVVVHCTTAATEDED